MLIITLAYQYAGIYSGVQVSKKLLWRTSTLLSWHYKRTSMPVQNYSSILERRYYQCVPVRWFLLLHTSTQVTTVAY
jgi:hypothetical protein